MSKEIHNRYREEEKQERKEKGITEEEKLETEMDEIEETENAELKKAKESYLRVLADFENYKRRTNDERITERKYANQSLLEKLVNIIDIFDKAVNIETDDEKLKNFLIGFEMINKSFKQILESEGVKKIEAKGKVFDPKFHHAMESSYDNDQEENIILEEFQTGYTYKERILRPSLVKVNQKKKGNDNDE